MFRKQAGDEIASLFNSLMKKSIEKTASKEESDCSMSHDGDESLSNLAADMMLNESDDEVRHHSMDEISEAKDKMHEAHDPKMASLMSGLGKIAASLRGEGEDFAADVVEATAISISKEASKKHRKTASVVYELNKIASDLRSKDKFAADLVEATISKIARDPFDEMEDSFDEMDKPELPKPDSESKAKDYASKAEAELKKTSDPFKRMDIFSKYHITSVNANLKDNIGKCKITFKGKEGLLILVDDASKYPTVCKK